MSNKLKNPSASKIFISTLQTLKERPAVYLPFLIFAVFEFLGLTLVFYAPRMPVRQVLGPPIITLWGERFLHYPENFLLLAKLESLFRMGLSVVIGSILTGYAVAVLYRKPLKNTLKKYSSLFLIVLMVTALFYILTKTLTIVLAKYFIAGHAKLLFLKSGIWMGPILTILTLNIGILIQSIFTYAIPQLIIGEEKFIKSVLKSFMFFKKNLAVTIVLVGFPMLFYIPIIVLNYNTAFLVYNLFPEFILLVVISSIIVSSLIIDPLITISTALLYLHNKEN